jgi:ATP-dependent RNA helicase SUPV3L1/SUV3
MFAAELQGQVREFRPVYTLYGRNPDLQELEELYSICDLVYYYCRVFNHPAELDDVGETRNKICSKIMEILKKQSLPGRRCRRCGKILPWNYPYAVCDDCFGKAR